MNANDRLFVAIFPAGVCYADRKREKYGDYARCAFLDFTTLTLKVERDCPKTLLAAIEEHAARVQARRGDAFEVSTCGQTVKLGGGLRLKAIADASPVERALMVMVLDRRIRAFLKANDKKALEQAEKALRAAGFELPEV